MPTLRPGSFEGQDFDESEFFADDSPVHDLTHEQKHDDSPVHDLTHEQKHVKSEFPSEPFPVQSDSEDSLVLSDCSSSDDDDPVEEHLRLKLLSLQSSLTQSTPLEELAHSQGSRGDGSQVGSLRNFGDNNSVTANNCLPVASMPVRTQYFIQPPKKERRLSDATEAINKLGTSMPIGIPSMQRRVVVGGSFENGDDGFIPPHLVEQQSVGDTRELFRSVSGLSPNAALKRERLAQRNYIMRATGFLETEPLAAGTIGEVAEPLRSSLLEGVEAPPRPPPRVPTQTSSLSAALGLSSTPK